jgi:hypothetical protein
MMIAIGVIAIGVRMLPGTRTIDDAFITFRYSRNLIDGLGLVYNAGEPVLGTTTPFWALLMAGFGAIFGRGDFPWYAIAASAVFDAVNCALIFIIMRRVTGNLWLSAMPALLWAIAPMSVTFAVGGMETSAAVMGSLAAFTVYITGTSPLSPRRQIAIGILCAFGLFTRIDSLLWVAPLFGWQFLEAIRTRNLPWITWAAFVVALIPWLVASTSFYGSPIPNTIAAKRFAYDLDSISAFGNLITRYSNLFFTFDTFGSTVTMLVGVLLLALNVFAVAFSARSAPRLIALLAYPWVYLIAFSVQNPLIFRWYYVPPQPALMIGTFVGVWAIASAITQANKRPHMQPIRAGIVGGFAAVALFTSVNAWTLTPDHGLQRPSPRMAYHALELDYQRMGEFLRDQVGVTAETVVASADIGAIGYFSRAYILDTVGLVTPRAIPYYPVDPALIADDQNYAVPPDFIRDTLPPLFVTMEGYVRASLMPQAWFQQQYRLLESYPSYEYGNAMQLWERVDRE